MVRLSGVPLPRRTLLLAAAETLPAALTVPAATARHQAWLWLRTDEDYLRVGWVAAVFLLCMYYHDLYDPPALRSRRAALVRVPAVLGTAYLVLAGLYLVAPSTRLRLGAVLVGIAFAGLGVVVARNVFLAIARWPRLAKSFVLVGEGRLARELAREIAGRPELGINLLRHLPASACAGWAEFAGVRASGRARGLILAGESESDQLATSASWRWRKGLELLDGAAFYETITRKVWLDTFDHRRSPQFGAAVASRWIQLGKRLSSVALSFVALAVTGPLMAVVAAAIRLHSPGRAIFRQQRVGQNGRIFTLYKFRTMRAEPVGTFRPAQENDARFTRLGRWLRRTRIDELPQLWNILRGDMAFVGPRPFAWEEERHLAREIPGYAERWSVKPGATGWAQVHRGYCATREDNVDKLAYDLYYIKHVSIGIDLLILFQTTKTLLQGRGAR